MAITVDLAPEEEKKLGERARASGQNLAEFVRDLIRKEIHGNPPQSAAGTFDQILAPVREGFDRSSMTEQELDDLVEEAREDVYREKHGKSSRKA